MGFRIAAGGQTIATASDDGTTKLIHADSGEVIRTFPVSNPEVWSVAFTPSGRTLAMGDKKFPLMKMSRGASTIGA